MMDEASQKSRDVWDQMAPGWERYHDYMWATTRHVGEWLVDHVDIREGDTILDLAGGPGDIGFLAAERLGSSGKVIVTDFAPQMVAVAERFAGSMGVQNVETRQLDAQQMDLADDSVDGIVCRWGFMLMLDPEAALKECRRVLKNGRPLAFSVWAGPENNPWVTVPGMTMMQLGYEPSGDPFAPGGIFSMSDPGRITSIVEGAGFKIDTIEEMPVEWTFATFDEDWEFMTHVAGPIARAIRELPEDEIDRLRSALEANMKPFETGSGLTTPGLTINISAS